MRQLEDKMMLRLPDGLRGRIKAAAKESRRSANAELVFHLERIFPAPAAATGEGVGNQTPAAASSHTGASNAGQLHQQHQEC